MTVTVNCACGYRVILKINLKSSSVLRRPGKSSVFMQLDPNTPTFLTLRYNDLARCFVAACCDRVYIRNQVNCTAVVAMLTSTWLSRATISIERSEVQCCCISLVVVLLQNSFDDNLFCAVVCNACG